jgi:phosphate/sulfate permease
MPALPQFDYIFAIGTIFAFLDAWNIGASSLFMSFLIYSTAQATLRGFRER